MTTSPATILPRLLPLERAAGELGVPTRTLRRWARKGHVPAVKIGGLWLIEVARMRKMISGIPDGSVAPAEDPSGISWDP